MNKKVNKKISLKNLFFRFYNCFIFGLCFFKKQNVVTFLDWYVFMFVRFSVFFIVYNNKLLTFVGHNIIIKLLFLKALV